MGTQMNSTARKIHNLLSSGAVTVSGPNQTRPIKKMSGGNMTSTNMNNSVQQLAVSTTMVNANKCYICDDIMTNNHIQHPLTEMISAHTSTKFLNKIGQIVGDGFMIIVSVDDVICSRCKNLINYLDRLECDVDRVRNNILNLLHKKYGINDDNVRNHVLHTGTTPAIKVPSSIVNNSNTSVTLTNTVSGPPSKIQKLNSGGTHSVQQGKISNQSSSATTQQPQVQASQQQSPQQQTSSGTQTVQRKTTKIYKCLSCEYKTFDMRLFNTHYENCKHQTFQCKTCKKIFQHFGAMKAHMIREHNAPMEFSCAVCHINFINELSLRKHMEFNHSTNVVVTSTTTVPLGPGAADQLQSLAAATTTVTPLYSCTVCQFKATDKALFDDHIRKHTNINSRPKPFKCRLCSQRFETRDAATNHAKQHQGNIFKCGTCSMSFSRRELLAKHFEIHQEQNAVDLQMQQVQQQVQQMQQNAQQHVQQLQQQMQQIQQQIPHHMQQNQLVQQQQQQRQQMQQIAQLQQIQISHPQQQIQVQQQQQVHQQANVKQQVTNAQQSNARHNSMTTQKLLQETIDEALSETTTSPTTMGTNVAITAVSAAAGVTGNGETTINDGSGTSSPTNGIRFYSCHICSLTFIQENYYNQHMDTHRRSEGTGGKKATNKSAVSSSSVNTSISLLGDDSPQMEKNSGMGNHVNIDLGSQQRTSSSSDINVAGGIISESDIESIFEKMHSEKGDLAATSTISATTSANQLILPNLSSTTSGSGAIATAANTYTGGNAVGNNDHVVITSQSSTVNGNDITFNITIPVTSASSTGVVTAVNPTTNDNAVKMEANNTQSGAVVPATVHLDMPLMDAKESASTVRSINDNASTNGNASMAVTNVQQVIKSENVDNQGSDVDEDANNEKLEDNRTTIVTTSNAVMPEDLKSDLPSTAESETRNMLLTEQSIKTEHSSYEHNQDGNSNSVGGNQEHITTSASILTGGNSNNVTAAVSTSGNENLQNSTVLCDQQVAMELDEAAMQAQVDNGQIKFILNENGQILQLENHIITDADGNQILVQDPEQIQQLLQSVGVLQAADGIDGETLQMMTDANGQMVLVQGENTDAQLIDASLLNSDGQLIIQQSGDGDGIAHVISEDGTRIPVVVSYTEDGQPIVQVQQQVLEAAAAGRGATILGKDCLAELNVGDDGVAQRVAVSGMNTSAYIALDDFIQQSTPANAPLADTKAS